MCYNCHLGFMLFQLQLQSALLNASSGVVQSLAAQTNIPATILSSALLNANMAATLSAASSNTGNKNCIIHTCTCSLLCV